MTKTLINGKWVLDPIKDYSNGKTAPRANQSDLVARQKASLVMTLSGVSQCKSITEVRKVLEHGRQTYPTK